MLVEGGESSDMRQALHQTIKKVSEDYERMKFNTAIAQMMTLVNAFFQKGQITTAELKVLLKLLNPVAPHITEEMWQQNGFGAPLHHQSWPTYDPDALVASEVEIAVQIKGKLRGRIMIPAELGKDGAEEYFKSNAAFRAIVGDGEIKKLIFVPGRLVNVII